VDVGEDTALGDGDMSEKLVQLLVISDGELEMTWDDTGLLVVAGGVASQFQDFGCEVFENSGQVDGGASTDTLSVVTLAEETVDTTDRKRETGLGGTRLRRGLGARGLAARFTACHFESCFGWRVDLSVWV